VQETVNDIGEAMEGVIQGATAAGLELRGLEDFHAVVQAHQRKIFRLLLGMVGDVDAAETLTQDCFLRAYRARSTYRAEASVAAWLAGIAVNLARDHARSRRVAFWKKLFGAGGDAEALQAMAVDGRASPERELLAREELRAVWVAVAQLSVKQRAVFLLRFVEEMSLEEISQATGMKLATVKTHLFRAVGAVRKKFRG
jgi:RNA polymerase sigma-70 factor, ECF subfamily